MMKRTLIALGTLALVGCQTAALVPAGAGAEAAPVNLNSLNITKGVQALVITELLSVADTIGSALLTSFGLL